LSRFPVGNSNVPGGVSNIVRVSVWILSVHWACRRSGITRSFGLHDVYTSEECFCTATRTEIVPIGNVDGRPIGNGDAGLITNNLAKRLRDLTAREGTLIYNEATK